MPHCAVMNLYIYIIEISNFLQVWLDEVRCNGTEVDVKSCMHLDWGEGDCGHPEDAGVKCHFPLMQKGMEVCILYFLKDVFFSLYF